MSLIYNATFDKNTRKLSFEDRTGNEIYSFIVPERAPAVDDITKPLTFKATQDGSTVKLTKKGSPTGSFQTSRDGGNTWEDYTIGTAIALNTGDEVSFRAKSNRTSAQNGASYVYFIMTGKIEAWHNVMSLYRTNDFSTYESVVDSAFYQMFMDCTSLTKAPVLPATTLAIHCCLNMFKGCTSLTEAPELPATTLVEDCYSNMFDGCTSLTEAPVLPATTLDKFCYWEMFKGCTSLTKVPELPEATLAQKCYNSMFNGCSSLNEVHCKIPSSYSSVQISSYTYNWLSNVASTGTFYTNADANWSSGASGIPEGWTRVNEGAPTVDDITKPLTFRATQDGSSVKLTKSGTPEGADFQTSRDGGSTWTDYTIDTAIALNTGDEVSFRAKADRTSAQSLGDYFRFEMTGEIEAWHNVMSLYRTNDFATYESMVGFAFNSLFAECTSLTKVPVLPATTLSDNCYYGMFRGCTSLTKAPALPATTLAESCYEFMLSGCTSLTNAPELPATTLAIGCYENMFNRCTSLVNAPVLPATTLITNCYMSMFNGCTSLTKAPELPATTLYSNCYWSMFEGCTSLTEAPALPATTLYSNCYTKMFSGCTSLTKAPELPATTLANNCYESMFSGCTSLTKAPELPSNKLARYCYRCMFYGCTLLKKSPALSAITLADYCYMEMFKGCSSLNEMRCKTYYSYSSSQISYYASNWLDGVASTGTFYTSADVNWPSGASGIPDGWTRSNI